MHLYIFIHVNYISKNHGMPLFSDFITALLQYWRKMKRKKICNRRKRKRKRERAMDKM